MIFIKGGLDFNTITVYINLQYNIIYIQSPYHITTVYYYECTMEPL